MNTRDERLEKIMQDASAKLDAQQARIAQLEEALRAALVKLRSTQANWNEQAYFEADAIITNAIEGK